MRNVRLMSTALLMLASAGVVSAQQPAPAPAVTSAEQALPGPRIILNLGYRASSVDGDQARWERFRDLRDGVWAGASYHTESNESGLQLGATNVGYHDQQYAADYNKFGKLKFSAQWNSIPLNYAYNTMTPWVDQGGNVWTLDPATRTSVQNKTAFGIGTTAAHFNQASVYRDLANPFAMQSRRDVLSADASYRITTPLSLNVAVRSTKRGGTQPYGGSFAFSNGNERPMTLDDRTNDVTTTLEWANPRQGMLRLEWLGSWYKNEFLSLTWDNPLRATDYSNGKTPPAGPYDPSGYSNGNGPAFGRLALPPSSNMNTFSIAGLRKLPGRSTLNGQMSYTTMKQDEALLPWTTNTVINSPVVLAAFPHLAALPRPTAEAEIRGINAMLNFNTRPHDRLAFDVRYRFNDRENRTPVFDAEEYVRFDAVPEEGGGHTEHYNIKRNTFETGATVTVLPSASVRLGYILDDVQREGRAFGGLRDHTFRLSVDTWGNQYVTVRGIYELTARNGRDFSAEAIERAAAQPGLRFYDEAELDRQKGTLIVQLNPMERIDVGLSASRGEDDYKGDGHKFGLLSNNNTSYNASLALYAAERITLGGNISYEKFTALQKSRNANPLSTNPSAYQSWTDANRDWNVDNDEKVTNLNLYVDLLKALPNTDLRLSYDRSHSDNAFKFSGPRIQELLTNQALTPGDTSPCGTTVPVCFEALPDVTNTWQELSVNVTHMLNARYGLGAGYSYRKLDIVDYATMDLPDGTPRIDPLGAITTGYGNRPYKGGTFMLSLTYMFQSAPVM